MVSTRISKFGYAASRLFAIIYMIIIVLVVVCSFVQLDEAKTEEKSNKSLGCTRPFYNQRAST